MEGLKLFRLLLTVIAVGTGLLVAARMILGPFRLGMPVNVPMNPEGVFGLAITLLLATAAVKHIRIVDYSRRTIALVVAVVIVVCAAGLGKALHVGFLSDDFILVRIGAAWTLHSFLPIFTHGGGDGFLRPMGYLSLAFDATWAASNPVLWHASALALHLCNSVMVIFLARRMGASTMASGLAGALFAIHSTRPEAVVWIAGRFDLFATFFLLAGLLVFMASSHRMVHAASLLLFALAALSKESAFIFPLLLVFYVNAERKPLRSTIPAFIVAGLLFAYRWVLLGGIGGYALQTTGRPRAFSLGFASTLKVLTVRLWTSLYFPINWTSDPSLPLAIVGLLYIAAFTWMAMRTKPKVVLWPALASLLVSLIPPLHLLGGAASLAGGRLLYLPSVWFCIFIAVAADGLPGPSRTTVACATIAFNLVALRHNLNFWQDASERAQMVCDSAAAVQSSKLVVVDLPADLRGVPFFANGLSDCVKSRGRTDEEVELVRGPRVARENSTEYLQWNPRTERLEPND